MGSVSMIQKLLNRVAKSGGGFLWGTKSVLFPVACKAFDLLALWRTPPNTSGGMGGNPAGLVFEGEM